MYLNFVQANKIRERIHGINLLTVNPETIGKASYICISLSTSNVVD